MGRSAVPWKNVSPEMEQIQFIKRWQEGSVSFVALCRTFGISRKTGYKRIQRFEAWSWEGLGDLSQAPNPSAEGPQRHRAGGGGPYHHRETGASHLGTEEAGGLA